MPKADVTMEVKKKHIIQTPTSKNGNSITKTRRRFLKEDEKQNKEKKISPISNRALECHDKTNPHQLHSALYALELTKQ